MARVITIRRRARRMRRAACKRRPHARLQRRRLANVILAYSFTFLTLYTIAQMVIFACTLTAYDSLNQCVFTFFGTEMGVLMAKRIVDKVKNGKIMEE